MTCRRLIEFHTLVAQFIGGGPIVTIYPQHFFITSVSYPVDYALVGMHLCSSLLNGTQAFPVSVAVVVGQNVPVLSMSESIRVVGSHLMADDQWENLIPLVYNTWFSWHKTAIEIPANSPISFYGAADSPGVQEIFSVASLQLVRTV